MNPLNASPQAKRWILIGAAIFAVVLLAWSIYSAATFHVTKFTPANNQETDFIQDVVIEFNQPVSPQSSSALHIEPAVIGTASVDKNKLMFTPINAYTINQVYTVTVSGARSQSGQQAPSIKFYFKPTHPREHKLPAQLVKALPHATAHYTITYTINPNQTLNIFITPLAILNRPDQLPQYEADLRQYKKEAIQYLIDNGGDLNSLNIFVDPDPDSHTQESEG